MAVINDGPKQGLSGVPRHLAWMILAAVVLGPAGQVAVRCEESEPSSCSLFVFNNRSSNPEQAYLSGLIYEALRPALEQTGAFQLANEKAYGQLLEASTVEGIPTTGSRDARAVDTAITGQYSVDRGAVTIEATLVNATDWEPIRKVRWTGHESCFLDVMAPALAFKLAGKPLPRGLSSAAHDVMLTDACHALSGGAIEEALAKCDQVLRQRPDYLAALLLRGYIHLQSTDGWKLAAEDFTSALRRHSKSVAARIGIARIQLSSSQEYVRKALQLAEELLEEYPDHPDILLLASEVHARLRNNSQALKYADRAVKILPDYAKAWHRLGRAQFDASDYKAARQSAQRATHFDPHNPAYWLLLGDAYQELGDKASAETAFRTAMQQDVSEFMEMALQYRLEELDKN